MHSTPEQTYEEYVKTTSEGLKGIKRPDDHFRLLQKQYSKSHTEIESVIQADGVSLACRAGCNFCCYLKVDVRAIEVFRIVDYLVQKKPHELPGLKERSAKHFAIIQPLSFMEHIGSNHLCPLNVDGNCTVYDVRPLACRNFHAQRVETCEYSFEHPTDLESASSQHPKLKAMGNAALYGINVAYEESGYDANTYDLGAALHNTFINPKAFKRWRDKRATFPIQCQAKKPEEG